MNRKTAVFLLINFAITWGAWIAVIVIGKPIEAGQPSYILYGLGGLLGPVAAALFVKWKLGENGEIWEFLKQMVKVKAHIGWYIFAFLIPLALTFIPVLVNWGLTGEWNFHIKQPLVFILLALPMFILGGGLEEVGWRGVMLPELCKKHSVLVSDLIIYPIWAIWHLPLWLIEGTPQFGSSFAGSFFSLLGLTLVLAVLYIKTKSLFLCILFHAFINSLGMNVEGTAAFSESAEIFILALKVAFCAAVFAFFMRKGNTAMKRIPASQLN